MILAWNNLADAATVSADSEEPTLPVTNVQQPHVARKWHTLTAVNAARAIFDMGASVSCSLLAIRGTNLTPDATLRLRASDADPSALATLLYDSGTIGAGVKAGFGNAFKSFTPVTARYWGLDLEDATVPDNLQIGRVFIGPSWTAEINQELGWAVTVIDPSLVVESTGGQEYADERPRRRQLQFTLNWLTKAEAYDNALALAMTNGRVRDVIAINDIADTYLSEQAVGGLIRADEPIFHRLTQVWAQKYTITERL
jgi:hypothetical protein